MNYDDFLRRGLDGGELWDAIKNRCVTHHDMLDEMRNRQKQLAVYSKHPVGKKDRDGIDSVQASLLKDIKFLETMAWRLYMFGSRSLFAINPGRDGELMKRKRTDPGYWKDRALFGERKADKLWKRIIRQEWERTILRRYSY